MESFNSVMHWFWYTWLNVGFNFFRINHIYFIVDYATMAYLLCWEYNTWLGEKVIYQCLDFVRVWSWCDRRFESILLCLEVVYSCYFMVSCLVNKVTYGSPFSEVMVMAMTRLPAIKVGILIIVLNTTGLVFYICLCTNDYFFNYWSMVLYMTYLMEFCSYI